MKFLWAKLLPLLIGVVVLSSCSTDFKLSGISISITDFRPKNATLLETEAAMTLRYMNENVVPIAVSGSTHKLYLNGTYVGKSVSKEAVGLPSLNTATQTVPVYMENLALVQKLLTLSEGTTAISYRLESELFVLVGEEHDSVKIVSSGQLDLSGFAPKR
ncbi:hypothetical protein DB347_13430 [Opitutaceae bacterium EW11]|nr:hypothetical protein DB347_13430 [Opitutaceae bacterium EW11]